MATATAPPRHRSRDAGIVVACVAAFIVAMMGIAALADAGWFHGGTSAPPPAADAGDPMHRGEAWLVDNLDPSQRLIVDMKGAEDLTTRGVSEERVVAVPSSGDAPDALAAWREYDYVVSTPALRAQLSRLPSAQAAIDSSMPVASFGTGADQVVVRRIVPQGLDQVREQEAASKSLRRRAGAALAGNPNVSASAEALDVLRSGQVDERLLNVLATYSVGHRIRVGAFPAVEGEDDAGMPRRVATIESIDGQLIASGAPAASSLDAFLGSQQGEYRPASVTIEAPTLRVSYAIAQP